ncbi:hypothetical protein M422DRAFT_274328 [Sphaerobolus stellatus SS14]|uniref:Uncharacterized protein n=1 Tax=Sphaerobolus stellatus (strain SS14) TaxID=990650 RepID=A0A0C9U6R9_SPHS4|nr:hypothetical protein M422DRAFT_274328 [Sphaerobolus stellatus SS14]
MEQEHNNIQTPITQLNEATIYLEDLPIDTSKHLSVSSKKRKRTDSDVGGPSNSTRAKRSDPTGPPFTSLTDWRARASSLKAPVGANNDMNDMTAFMTDNINTLSNSNTLSQATLTQDHLFFPSLFGHPTQLENSMTMMPDSVSTILSGNTASPVESTTNTNIDNPTQTTEMDGRSLLQMNALFEENILPENEDRLLWETLFFVRDRIRYQVEARMRRFPSLTRLDMLYFGMDIIHQFVQPVYEDEEESNDEI